jgi:hypothetical protein
MSDGFELGLPLNVREESREGGAALNWQPPQICKASFKRVCFRLGNSVTCSVDTRVAGLTSEKQLPRGSCALQQVVCQMIKLRHLRLAASIVLSSPRALRIAQPGLGLLWKCFMIESRTAFENYLTFLMAVAEQSGLCEAASWIMDYTSWLIRTADGVSRPLSDHDLQRRTQCAK